MKIHPRCSGTLTEACCKLCQQKFFYTGDIPISEQLTYLYDFPKLGFFASDIKEDWVGVVFEHNAYCRLCIRKRKVVLLHPIKL